MFTFFQMATFCYNFIIVVDCMDFGNYKKALQESDRILKKHPDSNAAKVSEKR